MKKYYDPRYDVFDGGLNKDKKQLTNIILYIDMDGDINLKNMMGAVRNINKTLLKKDIHLDYNVVRNYAGSKEASRNIFGAGKKPIILSANDDGLNATVDGVVSTYLICVRTTYDRSELVDRLNTIFTPNNKIIKAGEQDNNQTTHQKFTNYCK